MQATKKKDFTMNDKRVWHVNFTQGYVSAC